MKAILILLPMTLLFVDVWTYTLRYSNLLQTVPYANEILADNVEDRRAAHLQTENERDHQDIGGRRKLFFKSNTRQLEYIPTTTRTAGTDPDIIGSYPDITGTDPEITGNSHSLLRSSKPTMKLPGGPAMKVKAKVFDQKLQKKPNLKTDRPVEHETQMVGARNISPAFHTKVIPTERKIEEVKHKIADRIPIQETTPPVLDNDKMIREEIISSNSDIHTRFLGGDLQKLNIAFGNAHNPSPDRRNRVTTATPSNHLSERSTDGPSLGFLRTRTPSSAHVFVSVNTDSTPTKTSVSPTNMILDQVPVISEETVSLPFEHRRGKSQPGLAERTNSTNQMPNHRRNRLSSEQSKHSNSLHGIKNKRHTMVKHKLSAELPKTSTSAEPITGKVMPKHRGKRVSAELSKASISVEPIKSKVNVTPKHRRNKVTSELPKASSSIEVLKRKANDMPPHRGNKVTSELPKASSSIEAIKRKANAMLPHRGNKATSGLPKGSASIKPIKSQANAMPTHRGNKATSELPNASSSVEAIKSKANARPKYRRSKLSPPPRGKRMRRPAKSREKRYVYDTDYDWEYDGYDYNEEKTDIEQFLDDWHRDGLRTLGFLTVGCCIFFTCCCACQTAVRSACNSCSANCQSCADKVRCRDPTYRKFCKAAGPLGIKMKYSDYKKLKKSYTDYAHQKYGQEAPRI